MSFWKVFCSKKVFIRHTCALLYNIIKFLFVGYTYVFYLSYSILLWRHLIFSPESHYLYQFSISWTKTWFAIRKKRCLHFFFYVVTNDERNSTSGKVFQWFYSFLNKNNSRQLSFLLYMVSINWPKKKKKIIYFVNFVSSFR